MTEDAVGAYNLACFAALSGDPRRALIRLRHAVALGFPTTLISQDPDLERLRGDPEFQAILAETSQKPPRQ